MYLTETTSRSKKKTYRCVLLRESYRENGKVKNRTLANLSHCRPEEIEAIRLALKLKDDPEGLRAMAGKIEWAAEVGIEWEQGLRVGAAWTALEVAKRLGIEAALGKDRAGKLALWQVLARTLDQGSRLSAVRLARSHAACDILGLERGFDENDLYENLSWLAGRQEEIERRLFAARLRGRLPQLFLYDVTSSYLEGDQNALAAWGYNRDKKRGKKQIVIGLLCDDEGAPVSVEVFVGNTQDLSTFASQVRKVAGRFGCREVTFVGDRGMIKSAQVERLRDADFHFIGALTKPEVETLLQTGILQMDLFEETVCEVADGAMRYVLRRNPVRAEQMAASRRDKRRSVESLIEKKNQYLAEHRRAGVKTSLRHIEERIARLRMGGWARVESEGRALRLVVDEAALAEAARLDGCYVLKTDLSSSAANAQTVHDRYKDLAEVERAFRTCKTAHLEVRPVYVRSEAHTRAHVLVVMLAYLIVRELRKAWAPLDATVEEGLDELGALSAMRVGQKGKTKANKIPRPNPSQDRLLRAARVRLPEALPCLGANVVTRRRLPSRRTKP
jgi:hypothetical protein